MIRVGTSGFLFPDWKGIVYPPDIKGEDALTYYEQVLGFDCVELNFTFYSVPSPRSFEAMLSRTSDDFVFTVKLHRGLTHERTVGPLQPKLDRFKYSLSLFDGTGRLAALLAQMPPDFFFSQKSLDYLELLKEKLSPFPLVVEFRNPSWAQERSFEFLRDKGIGYCIVDEPPLPRLFPYIPKVASNLGYLRLHGRSNHWYDGEKARYDYSYSDSELAVFVSDVSELEGKVEKFFVFFNNCTNGQAAGDALRFKRLLGQATGKLPNRLF